ncbi:MAG: endonuclease/exonuclease/phosphatase (EEP) superfamily protein YafD [Saprospiraceae bacterium]|jgi:endonuclease/exonuclease/phosphatase (EEP) superfamily protein YafD
MELAIIIISIISILGSLLPFSKSKHWFVRGQATIRAFYLILNAVMLILTVFYLSFSFIKIGLFILLPLSLFVCLRSILPYTLIYPKTIEDAKDSDGDNIIVYIHNVYQFNDEYKKEVKTIRKVSPDVILLLETDSEWVNKLEELKNEYSYEAKEMRDDTYGIIVMSRIAPVELEVKHFVKDSIPSTEMLFNINDKKLRILGIHPEPPIPGEKQTSESKDKEIRFSARYIADLPIEEHKIIIGDFNDVAWSSVSKKFKKVTGMKDVRVGRGFFSTFPTYSPLQIPLDHVFCSPELKIVDFRTLEDIGSDHLPVSVTFQLP